MKWHGWTLIVAAEKLRLYGLEMNFISNVNREKQGTG